MEDGSRRIITKATHGHKNMLARLDIKRHISSWSWVAILRELNRRQRSGQQARTVQDIRNTSGAIIPVVQ